MSSSQRTDEELLVIAKKQLSLPPTAHNTSVPANYLAELKKHISIFPDDTNFVVFQQPGSAFGIVICLEQGCNDLKISLTRSSMCSDGERSDRIGSLMAYREHINNHPKHKLNRKARLSQTAHQANRSLSSRTYGASSNSRRSSSSGKSRLKLVGVLDRAGTPTSTSPFADSHVSKGRSVPDSSLSLDQPQAPNRSISRKRLSEDAPEGRQDEKTPVERQGYATGSGRKLLLGTVLQAKRLKGEVKVPFAPHDENRSSMNSSTASVFSASQISLPSSSSSPASSVPITPGTSLEDLGMVASKLTSERVGGRPLSQNGHLEHAPSEKMRIEALHETKQHPSRDLPLPVLRADLLRRASDDNSSSSYSSLGGVSSRMAGESSTSFFDDTPSQIESSSKLQLRPLPTPLQTQMMHDPMFRSMNRLSNVPNPIHEYEDLFDPGRGMFRDPTTDEDLHAFFQHAGNAEQFDTNASVTDALERLGLPDLNTPFPGLGIILMPHQVIGVAWMLDKERTVNTGGILSDEMGLGKTVQMIATIMASPSDDPAVKTNLIVAPLALLGQWKMEIEEKTNDGLLVLIYHGAEKARMKKTLQKADVVLTTYGTLTQEWFDAEAHEKQMESEALGKNKRKRKKDGFITSDSEDDKAAKKKRLKSGLLFTMKWHRIVLDEAQYIRNRRTRSSKAVTELDATYRWCLTGTPIINGLEDAFGLLRFLQIRPWYDWEDFNGHIAKRSKKEPNLCSARLQAIFATCLLRRKKDSMLDGKKLIELPPKDVQLVELEFSPEEQEIYKAVETRSQIKFNRYLRAGTVLKNYAQVLVLLLRLRQICTHTSLITEDDGVIIDDELDNMAEEKRDDLIKAHTELGRDFVDKLKRKLKDVALERMAAERESTDAAIIGEECPLCFDVFAEPVVTACMHFFCRECMNAHLTTPAPEDGTMRPDERACPVCRAPVSKRKLFSRAAFEPTDDELNAVKDSKKKEATELVQPSVKDEDEEMPDVSSLLNPSAKAKVKLKSKTKPKKPRKKRTKRVVLDSDEEDEDDDDLSDFIVHTDEDEEEKDRKRILKKRLGKRHTSPSDFQESECDDDDDDVVFGRKKAPLDMNLVPIKAMSKLLPSTKMKHMMNDLESWSKEHPDEKTMVVSQWTQALDLVSDYLARKGISHVRFQGNMNREKRDKAIRIFMTKSDATVMLMSLKCGGVGLNLTRANRVVSLDLGWSEAVENQAFDRVHRLGQRRPVFVERLVICNSVEDRVLALQEKKRNLADGSLGEGNGRKIGRLTVRELANLFGLDQYGNRLQG